MEPEVDVSVSSEDEPLVWEMEVPLARGRAGAGVGALVGKKGL